MHEALDLKIVSDLPDKRIRAAALAAANRSLPDLRVVTNALSNYTSKFCIGTSPICVLPVLYVNLDPRMIPTPQAMELMIHHATRPSYIDAAQLSLKALHHFTDLRIYPETVDACPDLWARVWPWMQFFDTYWEYIPGFLPSEYGMTRLIHCFVVAKFQRSDPVREISAVLPGLHLIFSRAWITLVLDPSSDQTKLFLQTFYLVPNACVNIETRHIFDQILEGADGSFERLAAAVLKQFSIILTSANPEERVMATLNNAASLLTIPAELEEKWLSILLKQGIIATLVCALERVFAVKHFDSLHNGIAGQLVKYLTMCLTMPPGYPWIAQSLRAGLLRCIIAWAARDTEYTSFLINLLGPSASFDIPGTSSSMQQLPSGILPLALVSRSVIIETRKALVEAEKMADDPRFKASAFVGEWKKFVRITNERGAILDKWEAAGRPSFLACDNISCGKIEQKLEFKRCAGCLSMNYCSEDCQSADWSDGHRTECDQLRAANIQYPELLETRERSFMRALIHHDYRNQLVSLSGREVLTFRQYPSLSDLDSIHSYIVIFDYTHHCGVVTHLLFPNELHAVEGKLVAELMVRVRRLARSGGRMRLHMMDVVEGRETKYRLFPLRVEKSDFYDGLIRIARALPFVSETPEEAAHDENRIRALVARTGQLITMH